MKKNTMSKTIIRFAALICCVIFISTCTNEVGTLDLTTTGYPQDVAEIIVTKCATPGCHTNKSKEAAAGLSLETWEDLFKGDRNGAACIPFDHTYSTIFLYTNTYEDLGPTGNTPIMPYKQPALTRQEMETLTNWIKDGAPNADGKIKFADNPNRKKFYVTNQECDIVTVFDAETGLQMRYIKVGTQDRIESAVMLKVAPNGKYWYVVFDEGATVIQRYNASDDSYAGQIEIGLGRWNAFTITNDSKRAFVVNWEPDGRVVQVDLENMTLLDTWENFGDSYCSMLNEAEDSLYVTKYIGNEVYKISVNDPTQYRTINLFSPSFPKQSRLDPYRIAFSPDKMYYYVTCEWSDEVRVFQASNDSIVAVIPVGYYPREMSFSKSTPYLFVTSKPDVQNIVNNDWGSVSVINYQTNTFVKRIDNKIEQPQGIIVDDAKKLVYVTNHRAQGKAHHMSGSCSGTNGYVSFIDLNTLESIPDKTFEISIHPFSMDMRK